jgi:predicted NBD/HSP70 family sugar kinase
MTATRPQPGRNASPRTARAINDRLALHLLHREGPLTAAQLKELTGLSRPSVADLVERLQESGLIEVVGESGAARRGPNARVYGIVAGRAYVAGLDVRVDSIGVEIADLLGTTLTRAGLTVPDGADPAATIESGVRLLLDAAGGKPLHTVACGAPGLVDPGTGRLAATGELPAWHADLVDEVRRRTGVPVLLENEVNLAAVAEQRLRGGAPDETFVLLWIGGGVGAALMLEGRLRRGTSGGAGEVGFLPVAAGGRLPTATNCDDGFHGLAGSHAVCALARAHGIPAGPLADAAAAADAVRAGSPAFLDELAGRIAVGAAAICAVLDPGTVVLAGEVGAAGGTDLAERVAGRLALLSPLRTRVLTTAVPSGPILRGAVITAMDRAQDALFSPQP